MTYDRDEVRKLEIDIEVSRGNRFDFYSVSDKAPSEGKPTYAELEAENRRLTLALREAYLEAAEICHDAGYYSCQRDCEAKAEALK